MLVSLMVWSLCEPSGVYAPPEDEPPPELLPPEPPVPEAPP